MLLTLHIRHAMLQIRAGSKLKATRTRGIGGKGGGSLEGMKLRLPEAVNG